MSTHHTIQRPSAQESEATIINVSKHEPPPNFNEVVTKRGVATKLRRRQRLASGNPEQIYLVKDGLLVLSANASPDRRQLLALIYPGDLFSMDQAPPLDGIGLVAMTDASLVRVSRSSFIDRDELRRLDQVVAATSANMHARALLHIARLASLPSETRVAAFILELALRMGSVKNDQISCDLPLSRGDIADYLSLNADTLSRIMTRLRERGAISTIGRSRTIVKNIKRLCQEVPVCKATMSLHGQAV